MTLFLNTNKQKWASPKFCKKHTVKLFIPDWKLFDIDVDNAEISYFGKTKSVWQKESMTKDAIIIAS